MSHSLSPFCFFGDGLGLPAIKQQIYSVRPKQSMVLYIMKFHKLFTFNITSTAFFFTSCVVDSS